MSKSPECKHCNSTNTKYDGSDLKASGRSQRVKCKDCNRTCSYPKYSVLEGVTNCEIEDKKKYIITTAVSGVKAHSGFLKAMQNYAKINKAQLIVMPLMYRRDKHFDKKLEPYLFGKRGEITEGLQLMADIKTQPTARRPLSGMETITGCDCGIFPHTKVSLNSIATNGMDMPKLLYTTGAVTLRDDDAYSDSKAGKLGQFHHSLAAVVVELEGDLFHIRHVNASSDGSFYDLKHRYSAKGRTKAAAPLGLTIGDIHAEHAEEDALAATKEMIKFLKPKKLFMHDVLNFGSQSHHNTFLEKYKRRQKGTDCIRKELVKTFEVMDSLLIGDSKAIVVPSNHHDHFDQWLGNDKNANCLTNARIFAETRQMMLDDIDNTGKHLSSFEYWARKLLKGYKDVQFLRMGESCMVKGVEHTYHGHKGPGGSRGSTAGLSKIGAKVTKGHNHGPEIIDGAHSVGALESRTVGFIQGTPNNWLASNILQYPDGSRTHLHIIEGSWRR